MRGYSSLAENGEMFILGQGCYCHKPGSLSIVGSCSQVMEDGAGDGQAVTGGHGNVATVLDRCGEAR